MFRATPLTCWNLLHLLFFPVGVGSGPSPGTPCSCSALSTWRHRLAVRAGMAMSPKPRMEKRADWRNSGPFVYRVLLKHHQPHVCMGDLGWPCSIKRNRKESVERCLASRRTSRYADCLSCCVAFLTAKKLFECQWGCLTSSAGTAWAPLHTAGEETTKKNGLAKFTFLLHNCHQFCLE